MMTKRRRSKTWTEVEKALSELLTLEPHSAAKDLPELATRLKTMFQSARAYAQGRELSQHTSLNSLHSDLLGLVAHLKDLRANGSLPEATLQLVFDANWGDYLADSQSWDAIDVTLPAGRLSKKCRVRVRLEALDRNPAALIRALDERTVTEYLKAVTEGVVLPPIEVTYDGQHRYLDNGQHRVEVHQRIGQVWVEAVCQSGSYDESVLRAAGSDKAIGLPRTREDKRRAVRLVLETQKYQSLPSTRLATLTGTSHTFVDALKDELGLERKRKPRKKVEAPQEPTRHPNEKVQSDPEATADGKPELQAETKPKTKPATKPETKPETKPKPETKLETKPTREDGRGYPDCNVAIDTAPSTDPTSLEKRQKREAQLSDGELLDLVRALPPEAQARFWGNAPAPIAPAPKREAAESKKPRPGLWNALEEIIRRHMGHGLDEIEGRLDAEFGDRIHESARSPDAEALLRWMLVEHKAAFDCNVVRLRRMLQEKCPFTLGSKVRSVGLYRACRTLGLPAPRNGRGIDFGQARQSMRDLVAQYHPDRNGGSRVHEREYQEVIEAFAAIREFVESTRTPNPAFKEES